MKRKNLEMIKLTEGMAMERYCEVRYADDDEFEFGVCAAPAASALIFEFNLDYPNITEAMSTDVAHLLNTVHFDETDKVNHLKFAN